MQQCDSLMELSFFKGVFWFILFLIKKTDHKQSSDQYNQKQALKGRLVSASGAARCHAACPVYSCNNF